MEHKFTLDEIKMLAEQERKMDSGEVPFVWLDGQRCAFQAEVLAECGCVSGQKISDAIYIALLEASIRYCDAKIAEEDCGFPESLEL